MVPKSLGGCHGSQLIIGTIPRSYKKAASAAGKSGSPAHSWYHINMAGRRPTSSSRPVTSPGSYGAPSRKAPQYRDPGAGGRTFPANGTSWNSPGEGDPFTGNTSEMRSADRLSCKPT